MSYEIRLLTPADEALLTRVADGVYDDPVDLQATREFLADPRHHVAVAIAGGLVVGSATAVHYVHPDKPQPELWINEVAVAPSHQGRGIAKALLQALFGHARQLGCTEAWVLTEHENTVARRLYSSSGGAVTDQVLYSFRLDS